MGTGRLSSDRAQALALLAVGILVFLGIASLAIDVGMFYQKRTKLQGTADATALAAAQELPNEFAVNATAHEYADLNENDESAVLDDSDIKVGHWDDGDRSFTPNGAPTNAVYVRVQRSQAGGNPVPTFFAKIFGMDEVDIDARAVAISLGGGFSQFIIDDEMIDSDVPVIEALAAELGIDKEELISDMDGDWFIDLPVGQILELPTGQVGDEGMFDILHPAFPFDTSSDPSFQDFLNYNEDSSSWRYDLLDKEILDPLLGVSTVSDADKYEGYVNPDFCQVSPGYKSDISALNPVNGVPAVNALGLRRGLLAFKILAVGADPDAAVSTGACEAWPATAQTAPTPSERAKKVAGQVSSQGGESRQADGHIVDTNCPKPNETDRKGQKSEKPKGPIPLAQTRPSE